MFFSLAINSFLWHSLWPWFSGIVVLLFVFIALTALYFLQHSKEFQLKLIFLSTFWVVLFLLFFLGYEQIYSLKLDELLEEHALVRDPQQFVLFLYQQAAFWATFLTWPVLFFSFLLYFYSSLSFRVSTNFTIFLCIAFRLQLFVFILVYRWIFPGWLLSISSKNLENDVYLFEPDMFRIVEAFFVEILDFLLFAFFLNFFYCLCTEKVFYSFYKQNRVKFLLGFFVLVVLMFYQNNPSWQQFCLSYRIFDFSGFMLFLYLRLNLWKHTPIY